MSDFNFEDIAIEKTSDLFNIKQCIIEYIVSQLSDRSPKEIGILREYLMKAIKVNQPYSHKHKGIKDLITLDLTGKHTEHEFIRYNLGEISVQFVHGIYHANGDSLKLDALYPEIRDMDPCESNSKEKTIIESFSSRHSLSTVFLNPTEALNAGLSERLILPEFIETAPSKPKNPDTVISGSFKSATLSATDSDGNIVWELPGSCLDYNIMNITPDDSSESGFNVEITFKDRNEVDFNLDPKKIVDACFFSHYFINTSYDTFHNDGSYRTYGGPESNGRNFEFYIKSNNPKIKIPVSESNTANVIKFLKWCAKASGIKIAVSAYVILAMLKVITDEASKKEFGVPAAVFANMVISMIEKGSYEKHSWITKNNTVDLSSEIMPTVISSLSLMGKKKA